MQPTMPSFCHVWRTEQETWVLMYICALQRVMLINWREVPNLVNQSGYKRILIWNPSFWKTWNWKEWKSAPWERTSLFGKVLGAGRKSEYAYTYIQLLSHSFVCPSTDIDSKSWLVLGWKEKRIGTQGQRSIGAWNRNENGSRADLDKWRVCHGSVRKKAHKKEKRVHFWWERMKEKTLETLETGRRLSFFVAVSTFTFESRRKKDYSNEVVDGEDVGRAPQQLTLRPHLNGTLCFSRSLFLFDWEKDWRVANKRICKLTGENSTFKLQPCFILFLNVYFTRMKQYPWSQSIRNIQKKLPFQ